MLCVCVCVSVDQLTIFTKLGMNVMPLEDIPIPYFLIFYNL